MPTNDFLPFAGGASNILPQSEYAALPTRTTGVQAGVGSAPLANKTWRQSAFMSAVLAQYICNLTNQDLLDDADVASAVAKLTLAVGLTSRIKLTATLNLYVATTGNDANPGTVGAPFQTLQKAWASIINRYDLNGFSVNVNVANGTYTGGLIASGNALGLGSGNAINFIGNVGTPTACAITTAGAHCMIVQAGAAIQVSGFSLSASGVAPGGVNASCLVANANGNIQIAGNLNFGACGGYHIWSTSGSAIGNSGVSYTISGGAQAHYVVSQAIVNMAGPLTITLSGTPAFSGAFALASFVGLIQVVGVTFSGTGATGARYNGTTNAIIATNGGGASYFPGNAVGSASTGAIYS